MTDWRFQTSRHWPIPPMDKASGHKDTAFTWAMGRLILKRIGEGHTMKAIVADPRMPAYCTVYRWMKMVPEFGAAVARERLALAETKQAVRAAHRRPKRGGQPSTYDPVWADQVLIAVEDGAALSEVLGRPGMPTAKAWYRWLRRHDDLAWAYAEACRRRGVGLDCARDEVIDNVRGTGIPAANKALRAIEARRGRITPRLYRPREETGW
ncbi:MAG: hypothetical protein GC203_01835 [Phenylobacterium sp.]|uniref:terminase small subunit-like protein n=1 Tax=Phenylobacterium sp. TaxID=1871053 RepID=UPI0025D15066|nr:hypothetical protein [Phenylobacterium sp.]MBI1196585.1 hypothetical protein [Phenylobacterium sp.]